MRATTKAACTATNPLSSPALTALRAILTSVADSPIEETEHPAASDSDGSSESGEESLYSEEEPISDSEVDGECMRDCERTSVKQSYKR